MTDESIREFPEYSDVVAEDVKCGEFDYEVFERAVELGIVRPELIMALEREWILVKVISNSGRKQYDTKDESSIKYFDRHEKDYRYINSTTSKARSDFIRRLRAVGRGF